MQTENTETLPNVLLIVIDQFRFDLLGQDGLGRIAQLPNLRRLQENAVSFANHFAVTVPCGPSRASLFTGQYAFNHRSVRNGTPLRHDTPNLARAMRQAGYNPRLFGYTDTTRDPRVLPPDDPRLQSYEELLPGFEEAVRMRMESDVGAWLSHLSQQGIDLPPYPDTYRPNGPKVGDPALYPADMSDTAFLSDQFLSKMQDAEPGWFATLTYIRPHPPLVAPAPYNTLYDPRDMPAPRSTRDPLGDRHWHPFLAPAQDKQPISSMVVGFPDLMNDLETIAQLRATYLALATEVDHHIGRVVDWLRTSGQWDNTVLIVTADHGEMLGDYGLWGKGAFHDAAYHVPLIVRDPARPDMHGRVHSGFTESIDIPVTILERVGSRPPSSMNGRSLLGILGDTETEGADYSFSEFDFGNPVKPTPWMAELGLTSRQANLGILRTKDHRLVEFGAGLPQVLFDMDERGEAESIATQTEITPTLLHLTRKMLQHRMKNADPTFAQTIVRPGGVKTGSY
ncbi:MULTISPECIES: sulfatase-like hydrolase/transferase [unclassified Ruegeria]|uniref:sulfatase-like hydrolase/transferase n=1 Tax=unclassified Ruegeria TaxID=2625375 RepID=UPI001487EC7E|nr:MULTISPECIES: sulfatase-like hydrolase/transferase [unclassified Ruegeria]